MASGNAYLSNNNYSQFQLRRSTVYSGVGAISAIPQLFQGLGGHRVLLITDKFLSDLWVDEQIRALFNDSKEDVELVAVYNEIKSDAEISGIIEAAGLAIANNVDSILAVGGGSVLDAAKMVKWMLHNQYSGEDVYALFAHQFLRAEKWPEAKEMAIKHIAVATTAGTGAEISTAASFYYKLDGVGIKGALMNPYIAADIAVLDPEATVGLPAALTAATGFDAFSHAVEGFFSPCAGPVSDCFSKEAISLIAKYLPIAVKDGKNIEARENLLVASSMAICGFGLSMSRRPIHNMAGAFGCLYHLHHGLGNAVAMPAVIKYLPELYAPRSKEFLKLINFKNIPQDDLAAHAVLCNWLVDFQKSVEIEPKFNGLVVDKADVAKIIQETYKDNGSTFYKIAPEVIEKIVEDVVVVK